MEINYSIVSSDDSYYLDYWPVIKDAWNKIGIKPVLVKISPTNHNYESTIQYQDYTVIYLRQIPNIKTSLQAQIGRIWAYKMLKGNCIMSDIDMMPISESYFKERAKYYNEDEIVSYCSDAAQKFDGNHPMCYILANNVIMSNLIKYDTWTEFAIDLAEQGAQGWSTDQWYITQLLNNYPRTVSLKRGWNSAGCADNRLDRIGWNFNSDIIRKGMVYDAHLPRPYNENVKLIQELYDCW